MFNFKAYRFFYFSMYQLYSMIVIGNDFNCCGKTNKKIYEYSNMPDLARLVLHHKDSGYCAITGHIALFGLKTRVLLITFMRQSLQDQFAVLIASFKRKKNAFSKFNGHLPLQS